MYPNSNPKPPGGLNHKFTIIVDLPIPKDPYPSLE